MIMDRTVPKTGGEEIQLYMRTYYSLLRSSDLVAIETLVESHTAMRSSLHVNAHEIEPDISALIYAALRLPACISRVNDVLIGQTERSFIGAGYTDIARWERVYAPGRRRRMHFNGESTLVTYIVSRSDIDDLLPILTAYQIEWNKLHHLMQDTVVQEFLEERRGKTEPLTEKEINFLAPELKMDENDLRRLEIVWQPDFVDTLLDVAANRKLFNVGMISGSMSDYRRATASWWEELTDTVRQGGVDPETRPIYFVSSNTHSLINLITGYAHRHQEHLVQFIKANNYESLLAEYETIRDSSNKSLENFLYYILGKYLEESDEGASEHLKQQERESGIYRVPNRHGFQIEAQIFDLSRINQEWVDNRLIAGMDISGLKDSDALIINIDYPLGMAAYEILSRISERIDRIHGVYVMGKAATLNGRIGDVMIPNVIHDEHSQNTYLFDNVFSARDVRPHMANGNVLDNQKAVTALGTFLQNPGYMSVFYREGYTDIEMESGPYLSAIYEAFRPKRYPQNEIVNLYGVPFDIGLLHYASDVPMKKGQNLGSGSLQFTGVEPTYAAAVAILRRVFQRELARLTSKDQAGTLFMQPRG